MDLHLHLPFWAILYSGFIFANGVVTILISENKSPLYQLSQLLSSALMICFFFIYYGVIPPPSSGSMLAMIGFILFQEIWVNRELYNKYIFNNIPKETKSTAAMTMAVLMVFVLLPLIYVIVQLF